jgi:hypothetical protein
MRKPRMLAQLSRLIGQIMLHCVYKSKKHKYSVLSLRGKPMATCTSCGHDVTGKKFCPDCGTPVVAAETATANCPRCNGSVKSNAAFCMHCGTSLGAQALTATTSQPVARQCIACHTEVPASSAFCTNCGQNMQTGQTSAPAATASAFCTNCGTRNNQGARFCNNCGQTLTAGAVTPQTGPYSYPQPQPQPQPQYAPQPYTQPPPQYGQQPYTQPPSQYASQPYTQQPPQYGQPAYTPQYNTNYPPQPTGGYGQPAPMLGQQPMVLRCPTCMSMAPMGTPNCLSCRTSLAGVVPTPAATPMQGQQQGGVGGFLQGNGGKYAMGALGGAAAVIGGEMLLHGVEHKIEDDMSSGYEGHHHHHREEGGGLLGGLGELGDLGLF